MAGATGRVGRRVCWAVLLGVVLGSCAVGTQRAGFRSSTSTSATSATSAIAPAPTSPSTTTTTAPVAVVPASSAPSGPAVQDLEVTPALLDELLRAFASAKALDPSEVSGPASGSVRYSLVSATDTYWATASFTPSPEASAQAAVGFQDGGGIAIFSHHSGSPWSANIGHVPWPCPGDVPAIVATAWGMSFSDRCVLTSPAPDQLGALLIDTSAVPAGFVLEESASGPGQATSAGQSLRTATGYWVRSRTPADEDYISVFLNLFPTAYEASAYNSTFSKEYTTDGPLLQQTTVPGVPDSAAYLNGGSAGGGPGSAAQPQPPTATAWFVLDGVAVGVYVSDHRESPLPIAQHVAADQYDRLSKALFSPSP